MPLYAVSVLPSGDGDEKTKLIILNFHNNATLTFTLCIMLEKKNRQNKSEKEDLMIILKYTLKMHHDPVMEKRFNKNG